MDGAVVRDHDAGVHVALGAEPPAQLPIGGVGDDQVGIRAGVDVAFGIDGGARPNRPLEVPPPALLTVIGEGVEIVIVGADVDRPIGGDGRLS